MSWRTIVVQSHVKLSYKNGYMISRGEDVRMVHLSEINTVIIDSTQVSLTSYLLCELVKRKIKVIFCDEKRNPCSELMSYYGAYNSSKKIRKQIQWDMEYAKEIWTYIVKQKILNQAEMLSKYGFEANIKLMKYSGWRGKVNYYMIMKIFSLENDIIFSEECINVLQIQDKKLFANVINSLNDNINGIQNTKERIIILDNDTEIKMEKEALMVIDLFNIDFNQKKIQSALYNKIEKIYKQEFERMSEFQTLFQKLQLNVLDVFNEFPFEFNYKDSIGIQEYLKLLGLKISNNKGEIIDKIFSLIDAVEYLSVAKLLIFVNLKLYLSDDELNEIYKYAMYKKVNILLIETGEEKEPIKNEKILFVDSDYDEIVLYNK